MMDKATGRVVAVIALLIAIAASLRGYLPGVEHADQRQPPHSGSSLFYVAALLTVSLVIVAVALITRLRDPRRVASSASPLSDRFSGGHSRPAWRVLLVGAAVLLAWLLLVWLVSQFVGPHGIDQPQSAPQSAVPANNVPRPPGSKVADTDRDVLRYLIASTVALLAMIVAGAIVARRRRIVEPSNSAPSPIGEPISAAAASSLVRAAESGLAEIEDPDHEPRQAIIACYAAMERELAHFPGAIPQDFDTPTEVLARAVEHRALGIDNAAELVNLFEEARFSPHVMNEAHRASAQRVLQLVLVEMRSAL
jgi:H+/Cl- antiporter ClcA